MNKSPARILVETLSCARLSAAGWDWTGGDAIRTV